MLHMGVFDGIHLVPERKLDTVRKSEDYDGPLL
jgi:hypothetical protein